MIKPCAVEHTVQKKNLRDMQHGGSFLYERKVLEEYFLFREIGYNKFSSFTNDFMGKACIKHCFFVE